MMPRLANFVIRLKGNILKKFTVYPGKPIVIIIGSDRQVSDVVVNKSFISKRHLAIFKDANNNLSIQDLNSTNGVYLNGKKIPAGQKIGVKFGDIVSLVNDGSIQLFILNPQHQSATPDYKHSIKKICIGRERTCDVKINSSFASSKHAFVVKNADGTYTITDNDSLNGTYINGRVLTGSKIIGVHDQIKIGDYNFTLSDYFSNTINTKQRKSSRKSIDAILSKKHKVIIGRSKKADYVIDDNSVSRKHAAIYKENNNYYVEDFNSVNGTFVNNKRIHKKVRINPSDEIRISFEVIKIDGTVKKLSEYSAIRTNNVTKVYKTKSGKDYVAVKPISFNIPSKSFIALMGPSGCGKSTLMNMLNGSNPSTQGNVYIHGLDLIKNIDLIKQKVGFVPQDDIVHENLTVNSALFYAGKLRMNSDTTDEEIWSRIDEVCNQLKIEKDKRNNKISKLSGGQRKRVSIAVELLNKPSILFLDEPTSPLDPETIDSFLTAIRELTEKENTTVIMVTHKPSDLDYVDRVIFLGTKGYTAYYGSVKGMYDYFKVDNIIQIYSKLSKENASESWYNKWLQKNRGSAVAVDEKSVSTKQKFSYFKQFYWLAKRYAHIKINGLQNIALLVLQPLLIPLALVFIYEKLELGIIFLMAITSIWFGVSNAAKEIVDEIPIYERERMYNLGIFPYILSKITVLSIIAMIQIAIYVLVLYFSYKNEEIILNHPMQMYGIMFLLTFSASLLGLLLSVLFKTSESVMTIIPIVLIPQIIFAGVITKIDTKEKDLLSYIMLGRWGTEAMARVQSDNDSFRTYKYSLKDSLLIKVRDNDVSEKDDGMKHFVGNYYKKSVGDVIDDEENNEKIINHNPINKSVYQKIPRSIMLKDTLLIVKKPRKKNKFGVSKIRDALGNIIYTKPITYVDGEKYEKADPIALLGFNNNDKLLNKFNSLKKNIFAIFIIDLVIFLLTLLFLKKKDKI